MRSRPNLDPRRFLTPDLLIMAALFLFAFALRVYGVRGSLPYVGHPDEPKLIDSAVHMVKTGDLNPHLFIWPSLYIYLEALVIKAQLVWGTLRGYYAGPQSLPDVTHIFSQAPGVYVWARTLTAVVGAATVALLFVVGREMFNDNRRVGVVAALMLAVSPLHIEYSHYALTDVPLGLMGPLVLWASYRLSRTSTTEADAAGRNRLLRQAVLCGLLVGLATGTKYNGLYLGLVPLIALFMQWRRSASKGTRSILWALAAIPLAIAVGFLIAEPYALLDWQSFYNGFTFQVEAYLPARNLGEVWASVQRHVSDLSVSDNYVLMPAVLGALVLLTNPPTRNRAWLLIPFPVFYVLAMSRFYLTYVRNMIVTMPFLAIMAGFALDLVAMQLVNLARSKIQVSNRHVWGVARWGIVAVALGFVLAEPLRVSVNYVRYMAAPESRNLAWSWMQERMREGDRFAAELHPWQTQDWPDVLPYDVENPDSLNPLTTRPPDWFASHGYNYIVLNSNFKDNQRDPALWEQYRKLPLVKLFAGDDEGGKGPTVRVYATGAGSFPPMMHKSGANIEDFATLVGYDLVPLTSTTVLADPATLPASSASGTFQRGEAIGLNLYYRALRDGKSSDPNWQAWIHLIDSASGNTVAQLDVQPFTGQLRNYPNVVQLTHPVSNWHQGELLAGVYNLALPANLPPGTYRLETGMWVPPNGPSARIAYTPQNKPPGDTPSDRIVLSEPIVVR